MVWPRLAAPEAGDRAASDLPVDPADAKIDFLGARDLAPQPGRPVQVRSVLDADLLTWIAARALAPGCSLVLLDEPFSNLDVEVRLRLRAELPGVLARCGASGVIVTHDPEEAMAICDRGAVQIGRAHV